MSLRNLAAVALVPLLACAFAQPGLVHAPDPATAYGAKAHRTAFEEAQPQHAASPMVGPAPKSDDTPTDVASADAQRTRTGVFWGGIGATGLGGLMFAAFGIAGRVTQGQLSNGYDDGSLRRDREDQLRGRGKAFNVVAATGAGLAVVAGVVSAIVYGIDFRQCGTLSKRRKDCSAK